MYFISIGNKIINLDRVTEIRLAPESLAIYFGQTDCLTLYDTEAETLHEHLLSFTNILKEKDKAAES